MNFSGKEGHPNIQPSTRPGIEPGTSGLGGRDLNHCANPSAIISNNNNDKQSNMEETLDRCAQANKLLGYLNRSAADVKNLSTRRTLYLAVVRPTFGYATQVWSPQSIDLIPVKRTERIQRRAAKFMLNLPYMCS